jgi:hypothetical protein
MIFSLFAQAEISENIQNLESDFATCDATTTHEDKDFEQFLNTHYLAIVTEKGDEEGIVSLASFAHLRKCLNGEIIQSDHELNLTLFSFNRFLDTYSLQNGTFFKQIIMKPALYKNINLYKIIPNHSTINNQHFFAIETQSNVTEQEIDAMFSK